MINLDYCFFDQFNAPICKSFKPKVVQNQLCYSVDPNQYIKFIDSDKNKLDLSLFIDYNEDRVVTPINEGPVEKKRSTFFDRFNSDAEENRDNHVLIYLDTIGNKDKKSLIIHLQLIMFYQSRSCLLEILQRERMNTIWML